MFRTALSTTLGGLPRTICAATIALTVGLPAAASGQGEDDGSKARVNLSSKLGMLSEMVSGAACRMSADIGAAQARQHLADAQVQINAILDGLEHGNKALGIPTPETRSRTLRALKKVREDWAQMSGAVDAMLSGGDAAGNALKVVEAAAALEETTEILSSEIQAFYTNPNELLFVDAIAIQMAGRQRFLTQKIAAEACLVHTGKETSIESILSSLSLFEKTLMALRDGLPAVGVRPPPNEPVAAKIGESVEIWQAEKAVLTTLEGGGSLSAEAVAKVAEGAESLQKGMNDLVILYILSTPGRDGAIRGLLAEMAEDELNKWVQDPALVDAVKAQNERHATLAQADIDALDLQWRAEAKGGGGPLVDDLMSREVSLTLRDKQTATAGFINEIFAMDNLGLNVAQSAVTSDYWQGDEDKFQESYLDGQGAVHIGEVEFDDSTGVFQSQVSIPVRDLDTGAVIGAITFGVNVQSLL